MKDKIDDFVKKVGDKIDDFVEKIKEKRDKIFG
jgi:hypothetical protein